MGTSKIIAESAPLVGPEKKMRCNSHAEGGPVAAGAPGDRQSRPFVSNRTELPRQALRDTDAEQRGSPRRAGPRAVGGQLGAGPGRPTELTASGQNSENESEETPAKGEPPRA